MTSPFFLTRSRWLGIGLAGLLIVGFAIAHHDREKRERATATARKKEKAEAAYRRPPVPVVARVGLPNIARKLRDRTPITVAFLGGSITQNASPDGFVASVPRWLEAQAPGIVVKAINAGLAATGSDLGAQRIDRDVLVHRPDLLFIEFAVNDSDRECTADMERIVRKVRLDLPATDLVFLYTISQAALARLADGKFGPAVKRHEVVAQHYGLPTIALGYDAAAKIRQGEWQWANFSPDTCHPTPAGYASYNREIEQALGELLRVDRAEAVVLPPSLVPGLVVRPPPAQAEPQLEPEPMRDDSGAVAVETFELPRFGMQWIGPPHFPQVGEPVWRLAFRRLDGETTAGAVDRSAWMPQRWFDETRSFTGSTAHPLASADRETGNRLGSRGDETAVLIWRAATAGAYLVRVSAAGLDARPYETGGENATIGVKVMRFGSGRSIGESLGSPLLSVAEAPALRWQQRVLLAAGDDVAFTVLATACKHAYFTGWQVVIGRFDEASLR